MITRKVRVRRWDIVFIFFFDADDMESIEKALVWADAPSSIIHKVSENISAGTPNEGFTYSSPDLRRTVFAISKTTSGPQMLDSTVHEIIHIAQHIAIEDDINPYGEEIAYLGGEISRSISDIVCELSCPYCSRHE